MPTLTEEDWRALDYQARQRRVRANREAANTRMAGDGAAAQAVRDAWAPVILARREAQSAGYDDPDCEDEL